MYQFDFPYEYDLETTLVTVGTSVVSILPPDNSRSSIVFSRPVVGGTVFIWPSSDVSSSNGIPIPGVSFITITEKTHDILPTLQWYAVATIPGSVLSIATCRRRNGKKPWRIKDERDSAKQRYHFELTYLRSRSTKDSP